MIITGNNMEVLKTYADNHFDSIVTDPPYGLKFMGKKWDYDVPSVELWKEVLRVLKPGGQMLCACGTRTQHRMVVNIEDAGFEIRDVITWHYGSGFPKSLSIDKAIDKQAGAEREVISTKKTGSDKPNGKGTMQLSKDTFVNEIGETVFNITAPATDAAKQWEGYGTALKPATEFWTLARKPLSEETVAENVLLHGTGGINIDGCRIETQAESFIDNRKIKCNDVYGKFNPADYDGTKGRFPSNLVFSCDCDGLHEDGCPVGELDRQSGVSKSIAGNKDLTFTNNKNHPTKVVTEIKTGAHFGDSGTASRFFYVAKASKSERNKGLEGMGKKQLTGSYQFRTDASLDGKTTEPAANAHPTVKPVTLMRYLCRLITPPKGIILDPFNGSGTTGVAAALEWFEYVGIEQDPEHSIVSEKRKPPPDLFTNSNT